MPFVKTNKNLSLIIAGCILLAGAIGMVFGAFNIISSMIIDIESQPYYNPDSTDEENCDVAVVSNGNRPCWDSSRSVCWMVNDPGDAEDCLSHIPSWQWITLWVIGGIIGFIGIILLIVGIKKGYETEDKKN